MDAPHPQRLWEDRSFWGMTVTQFLGAFNDNIFKQLVLLIGVDYVTLRQLDHDQYQTAAQAVFAIPFVLFSGFGGWWSDRLSKRRIVVACKIAEIAIMAAGVAAFLAGQMGSDTLMTLLLLVLFLMSTQSALFGPAKYGILPELFARHDLPQANGLIQMTTFLAIIFGMAVVGLAKQALQDAHLGLWPISAACVGIAVIGTLTSLMIRPTPVAHPGLPFRTSSLFIDRQTWSMLRSDRALMGVLLISSLFWFLGGLLMPTVNAYGKLQLGLKDGPTSLLAASVGVGIAIGCLVAGRWSRATIRFTMVRRGAWGMALCSALLASVYWVTTSTGLRTWASAILLMGLGFSAGLFAVPLQVFLQARPPAGQKGRMIGAMNLINWIGILLAAGFYGVCSTLFTRAPIAAGGDPQSHISWTFAVIAALLLPLLVWYRPPDQPLK